MLANDAKQAIELLIRELESASVGSAALDQRIEHCLGAVLGLRANLTELLVNEGVSWPVIGEAVRDRVPPYTRSLDAAVPGEEILFVLRSAARGQWTAVQRGFGGREILVWAATEPLARRLAAVKAHAAARGYAEPQIKPYVVSTGAEPPPGEAARDGVEWKVRF